MTEMTQEQMNVLMEARFELEAMGERLDAALSLRRRHEEYAERMIAERDAAREQRDAARALLNEAVECLHQLLGALDAEHDINGNPPPRSTGVGLAIIIARYYLQQAGTEPAGEVVDEEE